MMQQERTFWTEWAHFLRRWGLSEVAAALLEAAGPLNVFMAQMVYAGQPFLTRWVNQERLIALAGLFENQDESRSFAAFIREEPKG